MVENPNIPADIRNQLLYQVYGQCLKLLKPGSANYNKHSAFIDPWSPEELEFLSMSAEDAPGQRIIEYVQMGSPEMRDIEKITRTPAIYIFNDTDGGQLGRSDLASRGLSVELPFVGILYPIVLRAIVSEGGVPPYEKSNPVTLARIYEQLTYFLDLTYFIGIAEKVPRVGYQFPSVVLQADIKADFNLFSGIATPWEVVDHRLDIVFKQQRTRAED